MGFLLRKEHLPTGKPGQFCDYLLKIPILIFFLIAPSSAQKRSRFVYLKSERRDVFRFRRITINKYSGGPFTNPRLEANARGEKVLQKFI